MAASPEFYKPAAPAAFSSPCASTSSVPDDDSCCCCCRTPTGSGISYLEEPTTCPPAPRKPPACKKRLFQPQPVISLRLDELERIFRPRPNADKRPRGGTKKEQQQQQLGLN